jgi:hypothetical protein
LVADTYRLWGACGTRKDVAVSTLACPSFADGRYLFTTTTPARTAVAGAGITVRKPEGEMCPVLALTPDEDVPWTVRALFRTWLALCLDDATDSDIRAHRHRQRCGCRGSRRATVRPCRRKLAGASRVLRSSISVCSAAFARGGRCGIHRAWEIVRVTPVR